MALLACAPGWARTPLEVVYRAADVVYLNAGQADGLMLGEWLGVDSAELVVTHLASRTAACRVIGEYVPVRAGDAVTSRHVRLASLSTDLGRVMPAASALAERAVETPTARLTGRGGSAARGLGVELSGSVSIDWEYFRATGSRRDDFDRRVTRINFLARGLGSHAHLFRLRASGQQYASQSDDRLYEAAFTRHVEGGPVSFSLGRLGGGSRVGYGPLDGLLAEFALGPALSMGGFYGSPVELGSWDSDSSRRLGFHLEYLADHAGGGRNLGLWLAGVREEVGGETSRDFLTFESRLGPSDGRWGFQQRAEIDVNSGWRREVSRSELQLSNLSLNLFRRFAGDQRLSVTYDRFQLYRTDLSRWLPDVFFDDRARHSLRANLLLGRSRSWRTSLRGSVRAHEGEPDRSYSLGAGTSKARITPWRLAVGADLLVFSNPLNEGYTMHLRASRPFEKGRRLYFDVGRRQWWPERDVASRAANWLRLGGDMDLRRNVFLRAEYEYSAGDALAGHRTLLSLRYQFHTQP
jgi:hypothetical protein